ncbi:hypothetical protein [Acetivibrio cellulolyticus]|uniref:hypothetical protein n=1 Tax=Acetivibrio cellulolyticus TaxID=35830 RepID=UPI0001E2D543|nr:hypothetical protein [Acetivibrio cellulolyticus]
MLRLDDFIKNSEESDDRYTCYNLNKCIQIFNYSIEAEDLQEVKIYISTNIQIESIFNEMVSYLTWFSKCETELRTYYEIELHEKVNDTWFDEIEVYRVDFTFNSKDDYGATISCGDTILVGHILEIDFEREQVTDIRLNG